MKCLAIAFYFLLLVSCSQSDNIVKYQYPSFGPEINVTVHGLNFDAMEPFITPGGNYLLFNSLNDGINTKLYYALKINDSTFNYIGEIIGTNQLSQPQLNAVADIDSLNNFYWTSLNNYPAELDNLFHGTFQDGNVTNISRVRGNFNMNTPGWLVMDHCISLDGQSLYYINAKFDAANCQGPCQTNIGIATKNTNASFSKFQNSDILLQNIIDSNYIVYAPCISSDNLELFFTRYLNNQITQNTVFDICVSTRSHSLAQFSEPQVLFSSELANLIEAPSLTVDKKTLYYHKKFPNTHKIVMRYRK